MLNICAIGASNLKWLCERSIKTNSKNNMRNVKYYLDSTELTELKTLFTRVESFLVSSFLLTIGI